MKKKRFSKAVLVAIINCITLLVCITVPFASSAEQTNLYEGWSHFSKDASVPGDYVSYDATTHAFSFNTVGTGSQETLYLNRDLGDGNDSSDINISKFGKDAMGDFIVEYDVNLEELGTDGGMIEFAFMNQGTIDADFMTGSITGGNTDAHTIIWCRGAYWIDDSWQTLSGGGWGDLGGYYDNAIVGTGSHHMKIQKIGWKLTIAIDGETPVDVELPSDFGLPSSGYMGFFAKNAKGTISNVKVTNSTTGVSATFFAETEQDNLYEGWAHFSKDALTPGNYIIYDEETHAITFDTLSSGSQETLYLNRELYDGKDSSEENIELFGKNIMTDFIVEYDINLEAVGGPGVGGMIEFAFMNQGAIDGDLMTGSITGGNTDAHTIIWCRGAYWINNTWMTMAGGGWGDLGGYYNKAIAGTGLHRMKIEKEGWTVTITIDNEVPVEVELPTDEFSPPSSGYMGFYAKNARGTISNVKITNTMTDEVCVFFGDGETDVTFEVDRGLWETSDYSDVNSVENKGVRVRNTGEYPKNTSLQYCLPLDLRDLTFDFVPNKIATVEADSKAWIGFVLSNTDKIFNTQDPSESSGVVAEIRANEDHSAVITFKSLLKDEEYGAHTATYKINEFVADNTYKFGVKSNGDNVDIYLNGEKIVSLDWLKGVFHNNLVYLTTTASGTESTEQIWTIMEINGKKAFDYDSGLVDYGPQDEPTAAPSDEPSATPSATPGNEPSDKPTDEPGDKSNDKSVNWGKIALYSLGAMALVALAVFVIIKISKRK